MLSHYGTTIPSLYDALNIVEEGAERMLERRMSDVCVSVTSWHEVTVAILNS